RPMPAPISLNRSACSKTCASKPARPSAMAAVKPPRPPPTSAMRGKRLMPSGLPAAGSDVAAYRGLPRGERPTSRVNVGVEDGAAVFVGLVAKVGAILRTAHHCRINPVAYEPRLDVARLHGRREPAGEAGDRFLRRLGRGEKAVPHFP